MTKNERWGKPFVDNNRDWKRYNEELVVRGEFLLDLDWVASWDRELCTMNDGKRGAPYAFPESMIGLQAVWHQWVDYRGIEGIMRKLAGYGLLPACNDYSTINRRVNRIRPEFTPLMPSNGTVSVACDGTGMKMTNGGEYLERKHGKKKKKRYIKVTITADPARKKLLGCTVAIEGDGPSEPDVAKAHIRDLVEKGGKHVKKFWGDGAFDDIELFRLLDQNGIEPAIKPRRNALPDSESQGRNKAVKEIRKKGYKYWAKKSGYGLRWVGTEGIFSAVKRKFGETIRSTKVKNMLLEAKRKFWAYDAMAEYARSRATTASS